MESYGFEQIKQLPGMPLGTFIWPAVIGAGASLLGGALTPRPEQTRRYPEIKKNPALALALMRMIIGRQGYGSMNLPSAPSVPDVPDFAATLARSRMGT